MKFSLKDLLSKCDQIRRKLRICSHLLKKYLMEDFIICAVCIKVFSLKKTFTFFLEIESLQQNQSLKFIFWKECPVSFNSCIAIFQLKYLKLSFCKFHAQMNISVWSLIRFLQFNFHSTHLCWRIDNMVHTMIWLVYFIDTFVWLVYFIWRWVLFPFHCLNAYFSRLYKNIYK